MGNRRLGRIKGEVEVIIDAVALIDFVAGDSTILSLIQRRFGSLWIATTALDEVEQMDEGDCLESGMQLIEPTIEQVLEASEYAEGTPLSLPDAITFVLAKIRGLWIITNDVALRKECVKGGVAVLWGLETIALLVEDGFLPFKDAVQIATRIHLALNLSMREFCKALFIV